MKKIYVTLILCFLITTLRAQIDEGFETGFPPSLLGWQVFNGGSSYNWEHDTSVGAFGTSTSSASFDNYITDIKTSTFYVLRLPNLDMSASTTPVLEFDVAYARYSATQKEGLSIWYSFNGVSGWTNIETYTPEEIATAPDTTTPFVPTNAQWQTIQLNISSLNGNSLVRFAFEVVPDPDGGNIMYVDNVKVTDAVLSVDREDLNTRISLYPNPSSNYLKVDLIDRSLTKDNFKIYNALGQAMAIPEMSTKDSGYRFDIQHLTTGLYYLQIESDKIATTKSFLVE